MLNQEVRVPARSVVIVAPIWVQNVLSLWLQVDGNMKLVICATTFEVLGITPLTLQKSEADEHAPLIPDLIIFFAPPEGATKQVQKIKQVWEPTTLLVLADVAQAELQVAGADLVLPKAFSPEQFFDVMACLSV